MLQPDRGEVARGQRMGALIRARRRKLGLTLQKVSSAAGISVGYLSLIERDLATPSLGTLTQLAVRLEASLDYFVDIPGVRQAVTRAAERETFTIRHSSVVYERITADFAGHELSSFILNIPPGYKSETVRHDGEEIVFVLDGSIAAVHDGEAMVLSAGDSLHFRGNRPHCWSNLTRAPARVLWTGTLPIFGSHAKTASLGVTGSRRGGF